MCRRFPLLLLTVLAGCGSRTEPDPVADVRPAPNPARRDPKIPVEVSYPIIEDQEGRYSSSGKKRMVKVRLNQKVAPEVLREIALKVKASERRQYERTFIFYYLPERPGAENPPWASGHFDPTLRIDIMGLTKEDEAKLRAMPLSGYGERIGAWVIENQSASRLAVLYEADGRLKLDDVFLGGHHTEEMLELPSEKGRRFRKVKGSDVYEVGESGILRLYDREGRLMVEADPLK